MRSLMSRSTSIATSIGSCGIAKDNATALSLVDVIDSQMAQTTIQKNKRKIMLHAKNYETVYLEY